MLSDLTQYFTDGTIVFKKNLETEIMLFLKFIYENTLNDDYKAYIEEAVILNREQIVSIYEYFGLFTRGGDYHMLDAINSHIETENIYFELILSCFLEKGDYEIYHEEYSFYSLFGSNPEWNCETIDNYINVIESPTDAKMVKQTIVEYTECFGLNEENLTLDPYFLETTNLEYIYIKFKNKSKARKIRKLYDRNSTFNTFVKNVFGRAIQGHFFYYEIYNIEEDDGGYWDEILSYKGIEEFVNLMRKEFGVTRQNQVRTTFNNALISLDDDVNAEYEFNYTLGTRFIQRLKTLKSPLKHEVIM